MRTITTLITAGVAAVAFAGSASAATVEIDFGSGELTGGGPTSTYTEDGFQFVPASIDNAGGDSGVSGQDCPKLDDSSGNPCLKVTGGGNGNSAFSSTTLSAVDESIFTLTDFLFEFSGSPNNGGFTVFSSSNEQGEFIALNDADTDGLVKNVTYRFSEVFTIPDDQNIVDLFTNVTFVTFATTDGGTLRIDDIELQHMTPVPLPASGLLLLGAVGALAMRCRKTTAA